jgi:hypothetical protein
MDEKRLSGEEVKRLKVYEPALWWRRVVTPPRYYQRDEEDLVRCPSCGESVVRAGGNFRVPQKTDEKAWRQIEEIIGRGDDMVARFSVCSMV